jgi:hypothetical protein
MHGDRSFAMSVLAVADLFYPASPNHDPVPVVLDVGPLQELLLRPLAEWFSNDSRKAISSQ